MTMHARTDCSCAHGLPARAGRLLAAGCLAALLAAPAAATAGTIVDTRHNLSVSGPGTTKALAETRICIFCHTPHNALPQTPLWNKTVDAAKSYSLYASDTLVATPDQPSGPSRLCLSCHDGMIALGKVREPAAEIAVTGAILPGSAANVGGSVFGLAKDHPISFPYPGSSLVFKPAPTDREIVLYGGMIECSTCHDAHKDDFRSPDKTGRLTGKFLVADNRYSSLCLDCHDPPGWLGTAHQVSAAPVDSAALPVFPKLWPTWGTVAEWGCASCHTTHSSQDGQLLLDRYDTADGTVESAGSYALCYRCHNRLVLLTDGTFKRKSTPTTPSGGGHSGHLAAGATCAMCHDTHGTAPTAGTGDHTHLIDFDLTLVTPAPTNSAPLYQHLGATTGSCTLVCHGRTHLGETYP
jgi:predicted CXXCH cytochrome family protein